MGGPRKLPQRYVPEAWILCPDEIFAPDPCPDIGTDLRSDPIGVRMVTHTSKKAKKKPNFLNSAVNRLFSLAVDA